MPTLTTLPPKSTSAHIARIEYDRAQWNSVIKALHELGEKAGKRAIRNARLRWVRLARDVMRSLAPRGKKKKKVRLHTDYSRVRMRNHITTKIKNYRTGLIVWGGAGVRRSFDYTTPAWYLDWVERGHAVRRKRGGPIIGRALANPFVARTDAVMERLTKPIFSDEVESEAKRVMQAVKRG